MKFNIDNEDKFVAQITGSDTVEVTNVVHLDHKYQTLYDGLGKLNGELQLRINTFLQPTKTPTRKCH